MASDPSIRFLLVGELGRDNDLIIRAVLQTAISTAFQTDGPTAAVRVLPLHRLPRSLLYQLLQLLPDLRGGRETIDKQASIANSGQIAYAN